MVSIVKIWCFVDKKFGVCLILGQNPKIFHKNMSNMFLSKTQRRKINMLCVDARREGYVSCKELSKDKVGLIFFINIPFFLFAKTIRAILYFTISGQDF